MKCSLLLAALGASAASARSWSSVPRASFTLANGQDAIALNNHFKTLSASSKCSTTKDAVACVGGKFAQCLDGKFVVTPCGGGLTCVALPLVNSRGTSVTCSTPADRDARIARTGAKRALVERADGDDKKAKANATPSKAKDAKDKGAAKDTKAAAKDKGAAKDTKAAAKDKGAAKDTKAAAKDKGAAKDTKAAAKDTKAAAKDTKAAAKTTKAAAKETKSASKETKTTSASKAAKTTEAAASGDLQKSLTVDKSVLATGFKNDGQDVPAPDQVASLTSSNNFINFCATTKLPLTNGKQIKTGSCNPAPMGAIPSKDKMPSAKFTNPKNGDTIKADKAFTVKVAIRNLATGNFVNANENYFAAPQQLDKSGVVLGHSHVVIEKLDSATSTKPLDPNKFAFFKGLNNAASGGELTADVTAGLPKGTYKLSTINTAANHQPVLGPVAQHGSFDDMIFFTVA